MRARLDYTNTMTENKNLIFVDIYIFYIYIYVYTVNTVDWYISFRYIAVCTLFFVPIHRIFYTYLTLFRFGNSTCDISITGTATFIYI